MFEGKHSNDIQVKITSETENYLVSVETFESETKQSSFKKLKQKKCLVVVWLWRKNISLVEPNLIHFQNLGSKMKRSHVFQTSNGTFVQSSASCERRRLAPRLLMQH